MKKRTLLYHLLFFLFLLTGCEKEEGYESKQVAYQYLVERGYDIQNYEGKSEVTLNKSLFSDGERGKIYLDIWSMQPMGAFPYMGKTIEEETFRISNHPTNRYSDASGMTYMRLFIFEGEVIGGFSRPLLKDYSLGPIYPLDGEEEENYLHPTELREKRKNSYGY